MAATYPDQLIWEALERPFEYEAFERLKKDLPVDFTVIHSVDYLDESRPGREGECDFVVMHPKLGMLFLEVKGGHRLEVQGDHWKQWGKDGIPHDCDNPFHQARAAMHALTAKLKAQLKVQHLNFTFGYAVYLPGVEMVTSALPPVIDRKLLLDARDNGRIHQAILTAMEFWQGDHRPPPLNVQALVDGFFFPHCRFVRTKKLELGSQEERMVELTQEQYDFVESMAGENSKIMVKGAAGTGKTLLAGMIVDRALEQGKTAIFACFNRLLGKSLEARYQVCQGIVAGHFHSICYRMAQEVGLEWPKDMKDWSAERAQAFWDEESVMLLLEALEKSHRAFDLIVIDEAQDLNRMQIEGLLSAGKGTRKTQLVFFYDPMQNIYDREFIDRMGFATVPLMVNCRNLGDIAREVNRVGHIDTRIGLPGATGNVVTHLVKDDREHDHVLSGILSKLVDQQRFKPEDIVVLVPSEAKEYFREHTSIGKFLMVFFEDYKGGNQIAWTTVPRFKGLESEVVIVCRVPSDGRDLGKIRYVAYSRAKLLLHIIQQ
jgi:hypothetical protein